jgi:NAD(P)-dependent dehydrogenase (short-subunit alcohol dehydrogenase family)
VTLSRDVASLDGRWALVTGAARGIGAAAATALAAFGADLAICDRDGDGLASVAAEIEAKGRRVVSGVFDVRSPTDVEAFVAGLDRLDVLVNNAGGGFHAPFLDVSAKGQAALVDENFTSVTMFVRACVPLLASHGTGSVVNVTSVEAFRAAPGFGIYAAMKAAVEQLTKTLALELSDRGIRVNCIAPDAIPTPGDSGLAAAVQDGAGEGAGGEDYGWKIPLGKGTPDDCAAVVVFLASDLSRFVTGSTIHVDGGSYAASGWRRRPGTGWEP